MQAEKSTSGADKVFKNAACRKEKKFFRIKLNALITKD